jgi:hypothetical protein
MSQGLIDTAACHHVTAEKKADRLRHAPQVSVLIAEHMRTNPFVAPASIFSSGRLITSRLARRFRKKRLDDFLQIGTLALRAARLFRLMFLDGQNFAKSLMAFAANVLVKRHMLDRLGVRFLFD